MFLLKIDIYASEELGCVAGEIFLPLKRKVHWYHRDVVTCLAKGLYQRDVAKTILAVKVIS